MITKISVKNFMGLKDGEHKFGLINRITGKNGSGKTSIGKAILFAITGLDTTLSSAGGVYVKDPALMTQVDVYFDDVNVLTVKRGKAQRVVTYNKLPITDEALARQFAIPLVALGCMFFPESFFHLPIQKRRDLFMGITPDQDLKAIFASMTEDINPDAIDWNLTPKKLQDNWTQKRISIEKELAKIQGQYEEFLRNKTDNVVLDIADKKQHIEDMQLEINKINEQQNELVLLSQKVIKFEYEFELWKSNCKKIIEIKEENERRVAKRNKLVDLSKYEPAKQGVMEEAATVQSNLKVIKDRGEALNNKLKEAQAVPENCPTCGRAWECEKPNTIEIEAEIKSLREEYTYQQEISKEVNQRYKNLSDEIKAVELANKALGELAELPNLEEIPAPKKVDAPNEKVMQANRNRLTELMQKMAEAKHMIENAEASNQKYEMRNIRQLEMQKLLGNLKTELEEVLKIEKALHPKTGVWAEALKRKLAAVKIPGFDFEFTETLQNGEEKEAFRVVRDTDGAQCETLSSGEKIKFCMALSKLIAQLTGTKLLSIFLEHTDLVDTVPVMQGFQIFAERVVKDEELKIDIRK